MPHRLLEIALLSQSLPVVRIVLGELTEAL